MQYPDDVSTTPLQQTVISSSFIQLFRSLFLLYTYSAAPLSDAHNLENFFFRYLTSKSPVSSLVFLMCFNWLRWAGLSSWWIISIFDTVGLNTLTRTSTPSPTTWFLSSSELSMPFLEIWITLPTKVGMFLVM